MNKQIIITILLALITMTGQGQVKCHVEGTLETDVWGDEVIICEAETDLQHFLFAGLRLTHHPRHPGIQPTGYGQRTERAET